MLRYLLTASGLVALSFTVLFLFRKEADTYPTDAATLQAGRDLFAAHCLSCHGMNEEGIGPPLGGVTRLLSRQELETFIRNPSRAFASDNPRALAMLARYKHTMPSYDWMATESITEILSYIASETERFNLQPLGSPRPDTAAAGLSGQLVAPIKASGVHVGLEEIVRIPRLTYSTPDLGIATLRPHPSGDGRLFVSDQGGIIYEINAGHARIFLDLRAHIQSFSIGPGLATGLGSFEFHPDYLQNGLIYITHAEKYNGEAADYRVSDSTMAEVQWVLGEWRMNNVAETEFNGAYRELLRLHAPTFGHGAQDLSFIPGLTPDHPQYGLLYWGFGDGGSNNIRKPELGHHRRSFLGSILRIDPAGRNSRNGKYGIPEDNPFAGDMDPSTVKEIYAYGFRNPHRMSWDAANSNRMIVTDIGESNIEEVNIVERGGDYGWPTREGNFRISTVKDLKTVYKLMPGDAQLFKGPFAQYDHTVGYAISGGYVYNGAISGLKGKYVFGDIVNGRMFFVNMDHSLTDSTVYELAIVKNGVRTDLRHMTGIKRLHLRIGFDRFTRTLYAFTKADGRIYKIVDAPPGARPLAKTK